MFWAMAGILAPLMCKLFQDRAHFQALPYLTAQALHMLCMLSLSCFQGLQLELCCQHCCLSRLCPPSLRPCAHSHTITFYPSEQAHDVGFFTLQRDRVYGMLS